MIVTDCPICNFPYSEELYNIDRFKEKFIIARCWICRILFRWPLSQNQNSLYNEGYYKGTSEYSYIDEREDKFLRDIENKRRIDNLKTFFPKGKKLSLLDVGCSFGALVATALSENIDARGVDISNYVQFQSRSDRLTHGDVCDKLDGHYDIVTMIEVAEHLSDPKKAIQNCHTALNEDGLLLIQTTNMGSIVRRFEGSKSRYFLPGHLFYFSVKTLTCLLKHNNFKIEKIYYGHETGLIPALIRKSITNMGRYKLPDWLVILYTTLCHLLSKIHIGRLAVHNGMVIIARKLEA